LAISAGALTLALRGVDAVDLIAAVGRVSILSVLLGIGIHVIVQALYAPRWWFLLGQPPGQPPGRWVGFVGLGYLANYTLPGRPGELVRAALAATLAGVPVSRALGSLVLEKVLDGVSIVATATLLLLLGTAADLRPALVFGGILLAVAAIALIGIALLPLVSRRRFPGFDTPGADSLARRAWSQLVAFGDPVRLLSRPRVVAAALVYGAGIWLAIVIHHAVLSLGAGISLMPSAWLLLYAAYGLASIVPAAPGYLGTYQLAATIALGAVGIDAATAIVVATLYQVTRLGGAALVGGFAAAREGASIAALIKIRLPQRD
jgi:uncharacterized protein (TIRG00374 family)